MRAAEGRGEAPDRLESEDDDVLRRDRPLPTTSSPPPSPQRIRVLDATRSPEELLTAALAELDDLLT